MNKQYYIYIFKDENGVPFYIGKGHGKRYLMHLLGKGNLYVLNVIEQIEAAGKDFDIAIEYVDSEQRAFEREIELIRLHGRRDIGTGTLCNHTDGGEGASGRILSKETIERIRRALTGKRLSEQHVESLRRSHQGHTPSEANRRAVSAAVKGKSLSPEQVERLRNQGYNAGRLGQQNTTEHNAKVSIALTGRKLSEEHRSALRAGWIKRKANQTVKESE
jgi:hypothetical protein